MRGGTRLREASPRAETRSGGSPELDGAYAPAPRSAVRRRRDRLMLAVDASALLLAAAGAAAVAPLRPATLASGAIFVLLWLVLDRMRGTPAAATLDRPLADDLGHLTQQTAAAAWVAFLPALAAGSSVVRASAVIWAAATVLVPLGRLVARMLVRRSHRFAERTVIVGAGEVGQLVGRKLARHPEYAVELVGFLDGSPRSARADLPGELRVLGALDDLPAVIDAFGIDRVLVAFSRDDASDVVAIVREAAGHDIRVDVVPRIFELVGPGSVVDEIEGLPLVTVPARRHGGLERAAKRELDLLLGGVALVLLGPLMLGIALAIKLDRSGPVLFRQMRLGEGMREFISFKFRTMQSGTPEDAHRDYIRTLMSPTSPDGTTGLFKLTRDGDVTRVGRFLRRTSLDELPQLLNVLRGDMSLVGPRPCIPYEVEHFEPQHYERFRVPAGITGLWQVTARARGTFREALDLDVAYARHWSLGLDLRILLRTPGQLFATNTTR
jgi:exopolysaccharide biosynthesis polyprenyl glycosylphosphotransferase